MTIIWETLIPASGAIEDPRLVHLIDDAVDEVNSSLGEMKETVTDEQRQAVWLAIAYGCLSAASSIEEELVAKGTVHR